MSENNTPDTPTTDAKPKRTRPKKETFTVGDMAKIRAQKRGIDPYRAAKEVRGRLRANFAEVCKLDPSVSKVKSAANDGNRWPAMNAKVRDLIVNGKKNN